MKPFPASAAVDGSLLFFVASFRRPNDRILPRLLTSNSRRWAPLAGSTGRMMRRAPEYSTMPRAFRGASLMSAIGAFMGSLGSTSPKNRPASFSYRPAAPNEAPSKAGDWTVAISMRVMRARAGAAA